ncbi:MAG TPA: hypothetical protein VNE39_11395 [Planctomycetota bacterium]|nr:hypothetical protein [Planctomycetota bacterium]
MKTIRDCFGHDVRLTNERMAHILEHPEMVGLEAEVEHVLRAPAEVRLSRSDAAVRLFYRFYARTRVGGKWLCVVVRYADGDAFVVTAYLTDRPKSGDVIWPRK